MSGQDPYHGQRQRTNSATSYHSVSQNNQHRFGSDGTSSRTPIQVPGRSRNRYGDVNTSPGSYSTSPPLHSPKVHAPIIGLSDHRRELAVLQTPPFIVRQNPPSAGATPTNQSHLENLADLTSATGFLNQNIFSTETFPISPPERPDRPGTAPSSNSQSSVHQAPHEGGRNEGYFPPEEPRRPSVASVVTNASSTGSKGSSIGKNFYRKLFGDEERESAASSESSLPPAGGPNTTPRSHYGFARPSTPSSSRPRTPVPSADVVPFLYQDPDDIRRIGDAPVHEIAIQDRQRYEDEQRSQSTSHSHKMHRRGRNREREKDKYDKELPPRPSTASRGTSETDYRKGLKLHMDGTASSHSSQTRLYRSGSPTPSVASSLSNNAPKSPGEAPKKGFFNRLGDKFSKKEKDGTPTRPLRNKQSEPMLGSLSSTIASTNGSSPVNIGSKRGSAGNADPYLNPRAFDYASVDQMAAAKGGKGGGEGRIKVGKRGESYGVPGKDGSARKGKKGFTGDPAAQGHSLDTDFSDLQDYVNLGPQNTPPGPNVSWLAPEETPPLVGAEISWEPPESWAISQVKDAEAEGEAPEEEPSEGESMVIERAAPLAVRDELTPLSKWCIRVFRADSTFATISCKLNASVTEVLALLGRKSFLQDNLSNYHIVMRKNGQMRILNQSERPLKIQKRLLEQAGYTDHDDLDVIGREDHSYLVRFTFMMARTGSVALMGHDPGLSKVQKFSHIDLQGRNLLTIPIALYHKAADIISLNLSKNLSLNIPKDFIQQCVNLRKIEFTGNEAERLPGSIAAASRLTYLDISNNRLAELEKNALPDHGALVALKMSNNYLTSLPDTFSKFKSLRNLNLSSNKLAMFPKFICDLVTLVELDISFNMIKSFPLEIGQLSALDRLNATNNRLAGSLPQTFANLTNLKDLDLRYNDLQNIDITSELPRLESLVLSHNRISSFQASFPKLRAIHLNSNPVTRFTVTSNIPTLKFLNVSRAKIAAVSESVFERLPNLEKLIVHDNHIVSFPPQIGRAKRLEYLSAYGNEVASLPKEIGLLQELRFLDLHANNLKVLPGEMWQLVNLQFLNLSSNNIKEFPRPVSNPANMVHSSSDSNLSAKTRSSSEDAGKPNEIALASRRPSNQSGGLLSVGTVPSQDGDGKLVSVYGPGGRKASVISKASNADAQSQAPTTGTRKDSATSNRMAHTFAYSLHYLHLADNRLSDEVFEELSLLSELKVLNLSYNDLYEIPPRALSRMPMLNELYLSGNELTALPAEDLEFVAQLKCLYVNGNKFMTLPAELGKIRKLLVLDVGSNALKYNISNWPYDWNWNWNLELKYLNLSGNKRLEIKPNRADPNAAAREKSITDFSQLTKLRILGLMDVTLTIPNVPDESEDRRVRLSVSQVRHMAYGMADSLGKGEHLSIIDKVKTSFRGAKDEILLGLFDGQTLSSGGNRVAKYLHDQFEPALKEELSKRKEGEGADVALRRAFLNVNKELATTAMQTHDEKAGPGVARHPSTGNSTMLSADDLNSGASATVVYIYNTGEDASKSTRLCVANVGDCLALMVRNDGSHDLLTRKHDPGQPQELERIRDAGGYVSRTGKLNDVLETSRAFGYFSHLPGVNAAPWVRDLTLGEQDEILIIATKELWEHVSFQQVTDIARSEKGDLMRSAQKLRDLAIAYGSGSKIMVMALGVGDLRKYGKFPGGRPTSMSTPGGQYTEDAPIKIARTKRPGRDTVGGEDSIKPPEGDLAMVFTDIKNSTLLWETYPVAMRSAIRVHNNIMRRQIRIVGGYEVKTEGDAFMVCFPTATSAVLWTFSVQILLLDAPWPSEITDCEHGEEKLDAEGIRIYRGLSVRMGIHWGSPVCEPDPITRRMDYFGPIVNRAARVQAEADGGQIAVSSDLVTEIKRCVKAYQDREAGSHGDDIFNDEMLADKISREVRSLATQGFEIKELGERKLKGLENPEVISLMCPNQLLGRLKDGRPTQKPLPALSSPTLNADEVWALWEVAHRLDTLCSSLNSERPAMPWAPSHDLSRQLRVAGNQITDGVLVPLLEQVVTRIENAFWMLFTRRLLAPDPYSSTLDTAAPLMELVRQFEEWRGIRITREEEPPPHMSSRVSYVGDVRPPELSEINEESPALSPTTTNAPSTTTPRPSVLGSSVSSHQPR